MTASEVRATDCPPVRIRGCESFAIAMSGTSVVDAAGSGTEGQERGGDDDEKKNPGHRRGVAHLVELEGVVVQVHRVQAGRLDRSAVGHDVGLRGVLKRSNEAGD